MADKIDDILSSWSAGRNALLYGPPATGKTKLISELFQTLSNPPEGKRGILLDLADAEQPFSRPEQEIKIPQPIKVVWTTFHQSYGYEDFVLGLRLEMTEGGYSPAAMGWRLLRRGPRTGRPRVGVQVGRDLHRRDQPR